MKAQWMAIAGSVVLLAAAGAAHAQYDPWSYGTSAPSQPQQPAEHQDQGAGQPTSDTSAGGLPMAGKTASGPDIGLSRSQVYDELVRSQQNSESTHMQQSLYFGGQ